MRLPSKKQFRFTLAWLIPGGLFALAHFPELQYGARLATLKNMGKLKKRVEAYQQQYPERQPSLREVSEYTQGGSAERLSVFDRYGMKLDLRYLDHSQKIIKSWGAISFRNSAHYLATGLYSASSNWSSLFPEVIHSYPEPPALFQPAQLISSTSFDQKFTARLFVNYKTGYRTLVVVSNLDNDPIFIHDTFQPEEFFWLPGSRVLVFTSDPEHSPKGPLHFYDADHDELRSVKIDAGLSLDHKKQSIIKTYVGALAGAKDDKLYVYMIPYERRPFHPREIFHPSRLYQIHMTYPRGADRPFRAEVSRVKVSDQTPYELRREYSIPKLGEGTPMQKMWFHLKLLGNIENNIYRWQEFALKAQEYNSPMLPYSLMTLITLYDRVGHLYSLQNKAEGRKLRIYALNYSRLVAEGLSFPTWLNLVAWDAMNRLQNGQEINLSLISPLSQNPEP